MFQKKNGKKIIAALFVLGAVIYALFHINISSVTEYENERKQLQADLQMEVVSGSVTDVGKDEEFPKNENREEIEPEETEVSGDSRDSAKQDSDNKDADKKNSDNKDSDKRDLDNKDSYNKSTDKNKDTKDNKIKKTKVKNNKTQKETKKPQATKKPYLSSENKLNCTIEIRCDKLNGNRELLEEELLAFVPENGIILPKTKVTVKKGSSVYDVLTAACQAAGVAMDAEYTPVYGTYYVRGIGHLYEMDAGDKSGWLYRVNGVKPDVGASSYKLKDGDSICWDYTCDGE